MLKLGYGSVSTDGQSLEAQEAELQSAGGGPVDKGSAEYAGNVQSEGRRL
jgi:DNA invertase Pin-like site-specific DNA recombinase